MLRDSSLSTLVSRTQLLMKSRNFAASGCSGRHRSSGVKRSLVSSTLVASTPKLIAVSAESAMCR